MQKPMTPELDKLLEVSERTQPAGAFLDWLTTEKNLTLCRYHDGLMEDGDIDDDNPEGWYPGYFPIQDLLADWVGIDQKKAEEERTTLLEWARADQDRG